MARVGGSCVASASAGNIDSTDVKQEMTTISRMWRTDRWFLQSKCTAAKPETCHHGKCPPEQCPSGWIGFRNKCYFISEEEKKWTSSQTFCAENESMLATFETQEEMHSLAKHLKIDNCWTGLHRKGETFYWENGTALKKALFQIQNHSECAYLDGFTISSSAYSLSRCSICVKLHIDS
ncbi:C-type lectin domain family 2 member D6-like [Strigops habroptila]|uniref:C-type lectin domain family 2 member D6-like n=1 Tax=Strigops habroptila TaxID=2489341 RepID=A0A672UJQ4_STRHB|nr:C-type lectin domain family 2 member D6-like [Strigops habroptila]